VADFKEFDATVAEAAKPEEAFGRDPVCRKPRCCAARRAHSALRPDRTGSRGDSRYSVLIDYPRFSLALPFRQSLAGAFLPSHVDVARNGGN